MSVPNTSAAGHAAHESKAAGAGVPVDDEEPAVRGDGQLEVVMGPFERHPVGRPREHADAICEIGNRWNAYIHTIIYGYYALEQVLLSPSRFMTISFSWDATMYFSTNAWAAVSRCYLFSSHPDWHIDVYNGKERARKVFVAKLLFAHLNFNLVTVNYSWSEGHECDNCKQLADVQFARFS